MSLRLLEPSVRALVERVLQQDRPAAAAFDADGTLWPSDVGEEFLRWLEAGRLLLHPPREGAWTRYETLLADDPPAAFSFAVEVMEGIAESDLVAWSRPFVLERFVPRVYPPMRELLDELVGRGVDVWVVSASNTWVVRAAAEALGLDASRVRAFEADVDAGRVTRRVRRPLPVDEGKAEVLRAAGVRPALAAGNSRHDEAMLEGAASAFVVVEKNIPGSAGLDMARRHGWPVQFV